jgi:hypothetical protein
VSRHLCARARTEQCCDKLLDLNLVEAAIAQLLVNLHYRQLQSHRFLFEAAAGGGGGGACLRASVLVSVGACAWVGSSDTSPAPRRR